MNRPPPRQPERVAKGTLPTAPYASRPPSPPPISVPSVVIDHSDDAMSLVPSFDNVDAASLTDDDLRIITRNKAEIAHDTSISWKYESRRKAQPILDFLWLGPSMAAKDRDFLQREGITMLLAARDSRMAALRVMSVEQVARSLGIAAEYIDVSGHQQLIGMFPTAVRLINDHLLGIYRSQAIRTGPNDQVAIDSASFRRGKVLVFCETGNDRSAALVAAYIMNVYGMDLVKTLQYIGVQRFCTNFDEETKFWLRSYEGILHARRQVLLAEREQQQHYLRQEHRHQIGGGGPSRRQVKRRIEDTVDDDKDVRMDGTVENGLALDMDRYTDRPAFIPFVDGDGTTDSGVMEM